MNFERLLKNILLKDDIVKESFEKIDLDNAANIIEKYINTNELSEEVCYNFYKELELPYSIIYRAFGLIKSEISDRKTRGKLNDLLNLTAKVYIKKEVVSLNQLLSQKQKHNFLLFNSHEEWISQIVEAIKKDDLFVYPLKDAKNCEFKKYLSYLESLMICLDVNLCVYIHDLHNLIHTLANSLYIFYKRANYAEAYFVFRDLKEQILRFYNTLNELYISTFANVEKSFFDLVEILIKSKTLYVTVIDLKNLKAMNKLINEHQITKAKRLLFEKLHKKYNGKKNFLIINGMSNDFYFVAIDINMEEYENEVNRIYETIKTPIITDNEEISFECLILGIKLDKYSQIKIKDLINYFSYLKKEALKARKDILINNKDNHLEKWLKDQIDREYIIKKLNDKSVDIVFQPIFTSENNEIFSLEVLGRIVEKDKLLPAGMFIDHIYELGKIPVFDSLVLEKILQKQDLIKQITKRVFLNISFEALKDKNYVDKLSNIIKSLNIDIILELTEQRFVEDLELIEKINKNHNTFFAVDDFGSGYSSILLVINLLKKKMIRVLKIDGTLVKNIKNDDYLKKALKIISGFRKEFNLHLVAEFVEDEETLKFLREIGVDLVQGYYLSMPKTIEELLIEKEERIREIIS